MTYRVYISPFAARLLAAFASLLILFILGLMFGGYEPLICIIGFFIFWNKLKDALETSPFARDGGGSFTLFRIRRQPPRRTAKSSAENTSFQEGFRPPTAEVDPNATPPPPKK